MKTFISFILAMCVIYAQAQTRYNFENGMNGATCTNMSITNTGTLNGGFSLESSPLQKSNTYQFSTPALLTKGPVAITFSYKVQANSNWTLKAVWKSNDGSMVNTKIVGKNTNDNSTITMTPPIVASEVGCTLTITFTCDANNVDQNNRFWLDDITLSGVGTFPVTFTGAPKIIAVFEDYVTVQFTVADQAQMKQYNVQFSRDLGKTWQTVTVVPADNSQVGYTYQINVPLNSNK